MQDFEGKVAVVTGGASGIGRSIARAFNRAGMRVMLADIDPDAAAEAAAEFGMAGASVGCDVADASSVKAAAEATLEQFGKVHVVVNNAGVGMGGVPGDTPLEDWRWVVDINLMGVVHGVETFLPLIRAHGEGGHIVNTASMAGHWAHPMMGPYCATKFAVVGYSECLMQALEPEGIGVSVLCPGFVRTAIGDSGRRRPSVVYGTRSLAESPEMQALIEHGMPPELVGDWVVECMRRGTRFIFTHPDMAGLIEQRHAATMADYERCRENATLAANQTAAD